MSLSPLSARPLAHTAAKAPPICLNGTSAVPRFGFLGGAGFSESTMVDLSKEPNGVNRVPMLDASVRVGCADKVYLTRTVVSRRPENP